MKDPEQTYVEWLEILDMRIRTFYARQRRRYVARQHGRRNISRRSLPRRLELDALRVEVLMLDFN